MQCPECGAEVSADGRFCSECGASVPSESGGPDEHERGGNKPGDTGGHGPTQGEPTTGSDPQDQPPTQGGPQDQPAGQGGPQGQPVGAGGPQDQPAGAGPPQGQPAGQGGPQGQPAPQGGPQGQPAGQGRQQRRGGQPGGTQQGGGPGAAGPGPGGGHAGGYAPGGGGFDVEAFLRELPLFPGAVAGAASAIVLFVVAALVAMVIPSSAGSTMDLTAAILFDLQFSTSAHVTPVLYTMFEVANPPESALGFLYLLAPLFLFTAAKLVVNYHGDERDPIEESVAAGATVVIGYFPIMLLSAFLVPGTEGFSLVTAILLAGLLYPLLFGALGGLVAGLFSAGERRIGTLYGLGGFVLLLVLMFASSFVFLENADDIGLLARFAGTLVAITATHGLTFDVGGLSAAIPFIVTVLSVGLVGFTRSYRASEIESPVDGFLRALTPAVTYIVMLGVVLSLATILADPYVQETLGLSASVAFVMEFLVDQIVPGIGDFVTIVAIGLLVFPVMVGGGAGALAGWLRNRDQRGGASMRGAR